MKGWKQDEVAFITGNGGQKVAWLIRGDGISRLKGNVF